MDQATVSTDTDFWVRARRHLLGFGGKFVPFVPIRAEGAFLYDAQPGPERGPLGRRDTHPPGGA